MSEKTAKLEMSQAPIPERWKSIYGQSKKMENITGLPHPTARAVEELARAETKLAIYEDAALAIGTDTRQRESETELTDEMLKKRDRAAFDEGFVAGINFAIGDDLQKAKLDKVCWVYQCNDCRFVANPEDLGKRCRKCTGTCIRFPTSVEAESRAVADSNRINHLASQVKSAKAKLAIYGQALREIQALIEKYGSVGATSVAEIAAKALEKVEKL